MHCNLTNISVFVFLSKGFPPRFFVTLPLRARGFFHAGQGYVCNIFWVFSHTFLYSISENVPELRVVDRFLSEKTHENLRRDY